MYLYCECGNTKEVCMREIKIVISISLLKQKVKNKKMNFKIKMNLIKNTIVKAYNNKKSFSLFA